MPHRLSLIEAQNPVVLKGVSEICPKVFRSIRVFAEGCYKCAGMFSTHTVYELECNTSYVCEAASIVGSAEKNNSVSCIGNGLVRLVQFGFYQGLFYNQASQTVSNEHDRSFFSSSPFVKSPI